MSYSFTVRAATKALAKEMVVAELAKVVASQSPHECDKEQAEAAASAFIDVLDDDMTKDVTVSVHGSVGWVGTWGTDPVSITNASVGVSAGLVTKEVPAAA